MSNNIVAIDFEVFGCVQGVFFRKHTEIQAGKLGLRGWCQNTSNGTVIGHIEGPMDKIETMKYWLQATGSPNCEIDKVEFKNQKDITEFAFEEFRILRGKK